MHCHKHAKYLWCKVCYLCSIWCQALLKGFQNNRCRFILQQSTIWRSLGISDVLRVNRVQSPSAAEWRQWITVYLLYMFLYIYIFLWLTGRSRLGCGQLQFGKHKCYRSTLWWVCCNPGMFTFNTFKYFEMPTKKAASNVWLNQQISVW